MSELPADQLGYQDVVAEFFLGLRGTGLLLSPLDRELIAEWERRGLPVAVVCRGLRGGVEAMAPRAPRSLRAVRLAVEDEWRAYQFGRVGESEAPPGEAGEARLADDRLAAARSRLAEAERSAGPLAPVYRAARARLDLRSAQRPAQEARAEATPDAAAPPSPLERIDAALAVADAVLLAGWLTALPRPERTALGARLRLLAGRRPRGASRRAHRQALRAHLFDLARQAGLSCLRGTV